MKRRDEMGERKREMQRRDVHTMKEREKRREEMYNERKKCREEMYNKREREMKRRDVQ